MQWGKVKTVFIFVFAAVNLFLLLLLLYNSVADSSIPEKTVVATAAVLEQNGLSVEPSAIPRNKGDVRVFYVSNQYSTPAQYAQAVFSNGTGEGSSCVVHLEGNHCVVDLEGNAPVSDAKSAKKLAEHIIKEYGLNKQIPMDGGVEEQSQSWVYTAHPSYNDKQILDSWLRIVLYKADGSARVEGFNLLGDSVREGGYASIRPASELLVRFASAEGKALVEQAGQNVSIDSVKLGYFIGSREGELRTVTASPVWCISAGGEEFYYDARNGDQLF